MVDGGSRHHLLGVEDYISAFLLEEIDADRVDGAGDDIGRRVAALDGLEGGQIGLPVVCQDKGNLRDGQPIHEARVAEVANKCIVLLVPEVFHPFFVLIDDDEFLGLLGEFLGHVVAGAPAPKDDVLDTFLRNVLDRLRHAYNGVTFHGINWIPYPRRYHGMIHKAYTVFTTILLGQIRGPVA